MEEQKIVMDATARDGKDTARDANDAARDANDAARDGMAQVKTSNIRWSMAAEPDADARGKDLVDRCFDADEGEYVLFTDGEMEGPYDNGDTAARFYASIGNVCRVITIGELYDNEVVPEDEDFAATGTYGEDDDDDRYYPHYIPSRYTGHCDMFRGLTSHRCIDGIWEL